MTLRTLAPGDLPAAVASDRAAIRALQAWSRTAPLQTTLQLPRLGAVQIAFERVGDGGDTATSPEDVVFGVEEGGLRGRVVLDAGLALRLVSAILGRAPESRWRALGRSERGVLAAVLAVALEAKGCSVRLSTGSPPRAPSHGTTILLKVEALGSTGRVRLDVPLDWLWARAGEEAFEAGPLPISGAVELASTTLSRADLTSLRPGDAVVFDGYPAARGDRAWDLRLRIGSFLADAQVDADGTVKLTDTFRAAPNRYTAAVFPPEETTMKDLSPAPPSPPSPPQAAGVDATTVLAAAPIDIVVELGRISLRGDEVLGLARGHVLTLGGARTTAVSLCVGDSVWARGELVDVDGELGVRVLEVLRR